MENERFATKISLKETFLRMRKGEVIPVSSIDAKPAVVCSTVWRIKKEHGFVYSVKEKGMIDGCVVTRMR